MHQDDDYNEEEEETGGRKKGETTGTPTASADAPTGPTRSGVSDARNRRNHERWCEVPIHRRGRGI